MALPCVALILHQLANLFVSAWYPLCHVLVIPHSPLTQSYEWVLNLHLSVHPSDFHPYRNLTTVLADAAEMGNASLQARKINTYRYPKAAHIFLPGTRCQSE